ncbi:hypothetical protein LguiB_008573 [Lonicera macranthoides]
MAAKPRARAFRFGVYTSSTSNYGFSKFPLSPYLAHSFILNSFAGPYSRVARAHKCVNLEKYSS